MRLLLIACIAALPTIAASAEHPTCKDRDIMVTDLQTKFGEQQVMAGVSSRGALMEIWLNPISATWTAIAVGPKGLACIAAHGEDMMFKVPDIKG